MGFAVLIPETVQRKLAGWALPGPLLDSLAAAVADELAEHPARFLVGLPEPSEVLEYQARVVEEGDPATRWLFTFAVAYGSDEESLILRDCQYLCEDPTR